METQTEAAIGEGIGPNGFAYGVMRIQGRDADGHAINLTVVKKSLTELVDLYIVKQDASESYTTATKAIAEKAGLMASVVRKLVKDHAGDKFDKAKQEVEQLALVFEEVGRE